MPLVTTVGATQKAAVTLLFSGIEYEQGDAPVTERGFCWSTSREPSVSGSHVASATEGKSFYATSPSLKPGTLYFVRAYATNRFGTSYGSEVSIRTEDEAPVPVLELSLLAPGVTSISISATVQTVATKTAPIIESGICWAAGSGTPTISDEHTKSDSPAISFTAAGGGMNRNTIYAIRAYATNSTGIGYSDVFYCRTLYSTMTDSENNVYATVLIDGKEWMAENLRVRKCTDGSDLQYLPSNQQWYSAPSNVGSYCYANSSNSAAAEFGFLYNYFAVQSFTRSVIPAGWHLPSLLEWNQLVNSTDFNYGQLCSTTSWISFNSFGPKGTNTTGFGAKAGGFRSYSGYFYSVGSTGFFWTSDVTGSSTTAYGYQISPGMASYSMQDFRDGLCIRLVKD